MEHIARTDRLNRVHQGRRPFTRTGEALQHLGKEINERADLRHTYSIVINTVLVIVLVTSIILAACADELTGIRYINWLFFFTAYASALGLIKRFHPEDLGLDG